MKITKKMINELVVKSYYVLNEDDSSDGPPALIQWIQKNPELAAGITIGGIPVTAAVVAHYKDKKAEKEKEKDSSSSGNMPSSQDLTNLTTGGFM
jgi:hypothetical protein